MGRYVVINTDLNECKFVEMEDLSEELQLAVSSQRRGSPGKSTCKGVTVADNSRSQQDQAVSSSQPVGMPLENDDRDFQHKRAKILTLYNESHPLKMTEHGSNSCNGLDWGECNTSELSMFTAENMEVIYCNSNNDSSMSHIDSETEGNDGDDNGNSDNDNTEVRMDLTEDLLHMVFSFLNHRDLCQAGATCKQWHACSTHEEFWRCLNFKDLNISVDNFASICQRYPNATLLNLMGVPHFDVLAMEALTSLRRLKNLYLGQGIIYDVFFQRLTDCPSLLSLTINDAFIGSASQEITVHHDTLDELQIIKCRAVRISVRCPQLQLLSLKRSSMSHAALSCPQLLELDISSCHKLSDAGIRSAAATCSSLISLNMSSCSYVTDETLREISFACPDLEFLDASYCPNISLESVRLPMLRELKLRNCEGIRSASVAAIAHSYMLETLQLDCCSLLLTVFLDLPYLQDISLLHCRKLVDLNLRSPVLSSVKVSNCPVLRRINITSNVLKKLILQKQESLATLSLQCHNLQEVDLTDCESLKNNICDIFSDGGGCPMLQSLILDNCESLTEIRLISSSMVNLSLVGCRAMTVLELCSANLQKINLDGCDHLEKALFSPVGLQSLNLGICPKLSSLKIEGSRMLVLELQGCGVLSEASINCPLLLSLDASFCSQLKDDSLCAIAASCPLIRSLILSSCLSVGTDGLCSLHALQSLTQLDLSYTFLVDLQPVFKYCSQLKILKLMACKYLTNSSLDSLFKEGALPTLRELDLSYSTVGQSAIEGLLTWCTNLTNVNLNGCTNMHDLIWGPCDGLVFSVSSSSWTYAEGNIQQFSMSDRLIETLNCVGCPNIKKVIIPPSAYCFYLTKLNLHLSANLKEVDIACPKLNFLNLSHCSSLEILKLKCPRLGILILMACGMLSEEEVEIAIMGCNTLETLNLQHCSKIHPVNLGRLRVACPSLKRIHGSLWE